MGDKSKIKEKVICLDCRSILRKGNTDQIFYCDQCGSVVEVPVSPVACTTHDGIRWLCGRRITGRRKEELLQQDSGKKSADVDVNDELHIETPVPDSSLIDTVPTKENDSQSIGIDKPAPESSLPEWARPRIIPGTKKPGKKRKVWR